MGIGNSRQIGYQNKLLWHSSEDLKNFKKTTMNHCIVMGRKTFESIGRALPGRPNIVLSRSKDFSPEGVTVVGDLDAAFQVAKNKNETEVMIIGGGAIYEQALPLCDRLYLSKIDYDGQADTFFPDYNQFKWTLIEEKDFLDSNGLKLFSFQILDRVRGPE